MSVRVIRRVGDIAVVEPPGRVPEPFALAVQPPDRLLFLLEADNVVRNVEREVAVRDVAQGAPQVRSVDDKFRWVAVDGALGLSLAELLEELGTHDSLDPLVIAYIGAQVAFATSDVYFTCGEREGIVDDGHVWIGWDGAVHLVGPFDRFLQLNDPDVTPEAAGLDRNNFLDLARLMRSLVVGVPHYTARTADPAELYELERGKWERVPSDWRTLCDLAAPPTALFTRDRLIAYVAGREHEARTLMAGTLAGFFAERRKRELEWHEELAIEDITSVDPIDVRGPSVAEFVAAAVTLDDGGGPVLVVTDVVPDSVVVELAPQIAMLELLAKRVPSAAPATGLSLQQAAVVAALLAPSREPQPFRLPTAAEWERIAAGGGVGRASQCRAHGFGRVWEMTSTPRHGGYIVRGGRWRDRRALAVIDNVSWENERAKDVGFRAVAYVNAADVPPDDWEPMT